MPCDTVTTTQVDLGQIKDLDRLAKVATALGYVAQVSSRSVRLSSRNETINVDLDARTATVVLGPYATKTAEQIAGSLKRAYAAETIKIAAKRFGWQTSGETQQGESIKLALVRR